MTNGDDSSPLSLQRITALAEQWWWTSEYVRRLHPKRHDYVQLIVDLWKAEHAPCEQSAKARTDSAPSALG